MRWVSASSVLRRADDMDAVAAALRCVVELEDRDSIPLLVAIHPTLSEDRRRLWEEYEREEAARARRQVEPPIDWLDDRVDDHRPLGTGRS